ncbi:hypothetical protein PAL_GLEAN10015596 [Pteropus alecto]|uniref:Uncharacterized protein n=1 Tax=Pteropus alecto TaxID=9402 RepID=L5KFI6_PTEAL|nr:hypothetical protein PAL_GLEAN10015596 [Pteropus alecto]
MVPSEFGPATPDQGYESLTRERQRGCLSLQPQSCLMMGTRLQVRPDEPTSSASTFWIFTTTSLRHHGEALGCQFPKSGTKESSNNKAVSLIRAMVAATPMKAATFLLPVVALCGTSTPNSAAATSEHRAHSPGAHIGTSQAWPCGCNCPLPQPGGRWRPGLAADETADPARNPVWRGWVSRE